MTQKVTENSHSHAGQDIVLDPGLGLNLSIRSHEGHPISTLTTFGIMRKGAVHEPQISSIGLSSEPATTRVLQEGQGSFSSRRSVTVLSCVTLHIAPQSKQVFSPNPNGSMPSQWAHLAIGGATLDSISLSPSMRDDQRPHS
jgi:hypothetical protein